MAAWRHSRYWGDRTYNEYRAYVIKWGPRQRGRQDLDCADISISLLIEFAAKAGLPVTFWDNDQVRYPSKGSRQTPAARVFNWSWNSVEEYLTAVTSRIQSKSLVNQNTVVNRHRILRSPFFRAMNKRACSCIRPNTFGRRCQPRTSGTKSIARPTSIT